MYFTTFNDIKTMLCISTLNWTTLDNVQTTLPFSSSIFTTLRIWPFEKKIKPQFKNKIMFLSFKDKAGLKIFFIFFPILRGICKRIFAEPLKFVKHRIYWITKSIFKSSHFVKCQLVFNFKRQVQAHYNYRSFDFIYLLNVLENRNATL